MSHTIKTDRANPEPRSDIKPAPNGPALNPPDAAPPAGSSRRKLWLALLALGVVIAAGAYAWYYFTYAQYHESTDDAYVNGNLVQLTPQVTGTVNAVNSDDTQIVNAG